MVVGLQGLGDATGGGGWGCAIAVSMASSAVGSGRRTVPGRCAGEQKKEVAPHRSCPGLGSVQPAQVCQVER